MPTNIFQDPTNGLPKQDSQIVRVGMKQEDIGGRTSHLPTNVKSPDLAIQHVPNAGSKH